MPWLRKVEVSFSVVDENEDDVSSQFRMIQGGEVDQDQGMNTKGKGPFQWKRKCPVLNKPVSCINDGDGDNGGGEEYKKVRKFRLMAHVSLTFGEGCTLQSAELDYHVGLGDDGTSGGVEEALRGVEYSFETIRVSYPIDDGDDKGDDKDVGRQGLGVGRDETTKRDEKRGAGGGGGEHDEIGGGSDAKRMKRDFDFDLDLNVNDDDKGDGDGDGGGGGGGSSVSTPHPTPHPMGTVLL